MAAGVVGTTSAILLGVAEGYAGVAATIALLDFARSVNRG